jgi:outer membrane protein
VGEVTRTDVAQTQSRYAGSKAEMALAQSNLRASVARFKQIIGLEPKKLAPVQPLAAGRLPKNQGEAVNRALQNHPLIAAALHGVDVQELQVKIVTGELMPSLNVSGSLSQRFDTQIGTHKVVSATVASTLTVPIYDGGSAHARTRAAKETLGERRLQVDSARDRIVANAIAAWALTEATTYQIEGTNAQVKAAEIALNGVREEAKVGQRTTLDVLNAEQELLNARVAQVSAQRDRVVASYSLLSATGALSASKLGLKVAAYRPEVHYEEVKDKWIGLRTPAGE